eukprot:CAMPEP_0118937706 /NCGR_PEP_ID=MMETSP1169-20130426/23554_1 /TAXON_ID=36882 /ORGANISM="Pyramimonas obovata, Strain CCMP722" /LENGTH=179 /DNA_ID=CAMNT_0006881425 /DNA_START=202 /DNA_END=738 /DNA_ORIENTATION=+
MGKGKNRGPRTRRGRGGAQFEEEYEYEDQRQYTADRSEVFNFFLMTILLTLERIFSRFFPTKSEQNYRRGFGDESEGGWGGYNQRMPGGGSGAHPGGASAKKKEELDPFAVLELKKEDCTLEELKRAFKVMARKWHPDKNNQSEESKAKMQQINWAYEKCLAELDPSSAKPDSDDEAAE